MKATCKMNILVWARSPTTPCGGSALPGSKEKAFQLSRHGKYEKIRGNQVCCLNGISEERVETRIHRHKDALKKAKAKRQRDITLVPTETGKSNRPGSGTPKEKYRFEDGLATNVGFLQA